MPDPFLRKLPLLDPQRVPAGVAANLPVTGGAAAGFLCPDTRQFQIDG